MPAGVPQVDELGVTSAPLKSASFFIGEFCKPYNGPFPSRSRLVSAPSTPFRARIGSRFASCAPANAEDFMLCKAENRDPAHCLKEGRKVTRCAQDLCDLQGPVDVLEGVRRSLAVLGEEQPGSPSSPSLPQGAAKLSKSLCCERTGVLPVPEAGEGIQQLRVREAEAEEGHSRLTRRPAAGAREELAHLRRDPEVDKRSKRMVSVVN
ncbi:SPOSA6832_00561, partial [Sporobolomyces salmonicolor]